MNRKATYFIESAFTVFEFNPSSAQVTESISIKNEVDISSQDRKLLKKINNSNFKKALVHLQVKRTNDPNFFLNLQQVLSLKKIEGLCLESISREIFLKMNKQYKTSQEVISNLKKII